MIDPMLQRIRIVLVETSHPGNIGAAARAMKVMGLSRLVLVRPKIFPSAEATARASGADDVLQDAQVVDDLDTALEGCTLVLGTSARLRSLRWPQLDPRQAGERAWSRARTGEVAVVFGREQSGLSNPELERCHYLLHIPSNPEYGSLNVASAVQLAAYEIRMASLSAEAPVAEVGEEKEWATVDEVNGFLGHLEGALQTIGFLDPDNPRWMMRRMRRLFGRAHLYRDEVHLLRGMLSSVLKFRDAGRSSGEKGE